MQVTRWVCPVGHLFEAEVLPFAYVGVAGPHLNESVGPVCPVCYIEWIKKNVPVVSPVVVETMQADSVSNPPGITTKMLPMPTPMIVSSTEGHQAPRLDTRPKGDAQHSRKKLSRKSHPMKSS